MGPGSRYEKKAEKIVCCILKRGEWKKLRNTKSLVRVFLWNTLLFAPGILLNVNRMKVKERVFGDGNR